MLKFGITIPNLNQSRFLYTALMSLRHQSSLFELALMDGGSSDNFFRVANQFKDLVSYQQSKPDEGQSAAIRASTKLIGGDILCWLNADDYYFPNILEKVQAVFENNPDVDVVYGDAVHVDADGFFQCYFPAIQKFNRHALTYNCFICQPACFYRRAIYDSVDGIDPNLHYTMDWDLWCRFANQNANFYYLPEPLAAVRYYPGTKTLSGAQRRFQEIYRIERKYGHRIFPRSVIGAYYYGLTQKEPQTAIEKLGFNVMSQLRSFKNKWTRQTRLYGFQRWDTIFEKRCEIHFPWYENKNWTNLRLKIEPSVYPYRVQLNGIALDVIKGQDGEFVADLPKIDTFHRILQIESPHSNPCKLIGVKCDLL